MRFRKTGALRILDFDIETRRIGFHNGGKFNPDGCEPVVIATAWEGGDVETWSLRPTWSERDARKMLTEFRARYEESDAVTGHYITKFDLPILNGAMLEWGFPPLPPKLTIDTKVGLVRFAGMSASQENLSALKRLGESKFHMNDEWWRKVARLTPEGLALAKTRVVDDVRQHQSLRSSMAGWFRSPTVWAP